MYKLQDNAYLIGLLDVFEARFKHRSFKDIYSLSNISKRFHYDTLIKKTLPSTHTYVPIVWFIKHVTKNLISMTRIRRTNLNFITRKLRKLWKLWKKVLQIPASSKWHIYHFYRTSTATFSLHTATCIISVNFINLAFTLLIPIKYLWHEAISGRRSSEIVSCIWRPVTS